MFTRLALGDPRIDLAVVAREYGEIPTDPMPQNRLWYKLFREYGERTNVSPTLIDSTF